MGCLNLGSIFPLLFFNYISLEEGGGEAEKRVAACVACVQTLTHQCGPSSWHPRASQGPPKAAKGPPHLASCSQFAGFQLQAFNSPVKSKVHVRAHATTQGSCCCMAKAVESKPDSP